jgi:glycosyltransferase involved in cell wall biosynthesis
MQMDLVSIVMNCYNGERYLNNAISSIVNQTYENWEIIFWDNKSSDNSAEIVKSFNDSRIKYYLSNENLKLGQARNCALEKCNGSYICFLDVDDYWDPEKIKYQISWFLKKPDFGFLYTNYNIVYSNSIKKKILSKNQPEGYVFSDFLEHYPVNLQTVMIKRDCLFKLSYFFDPKLELAEEYDLFLRLLLTSKAGYIDRPLAFYRVHSDMSSILRIKEWPNEMEFILNKYSIEIPDFKSKYAKSIEKLNTKIAYYKARIEILNTNYSQGRKILLPFIFENYKIAGLYLVSFCGREFWSFVHKIFGKII